MIHHFVTVDSTNIVAAGMAVDGAPHGTVIHALRQTGGRGRAGREFSSPDGGLYFSLILRPDLDPGDLPLITLAAGVGLCEGISTYSDAMLRLKWPNDLYLDDRKLGGILTESGPFRSGAGPEYVIVGAGINVSSSSEQFPSSLHGRVISLYHAGECAVELNTLLASCVDALLLSVRLLAEDRTRLLAHWRRLDYLQGLDLEYDGDGGMTSAVGIGLADDGRYIVRDREGVEYRVLAGDINPIRLRSGRAEQA